ncbi:MAG: DUF6045 family protein [Oscillospiraceae bacterium]
MFIWDFILGDVMDQVVEWVYGQVVGFLADFFAQMGNMGVDMFSHNSIDNIDRLLLIVIPFKHHP